VAFGRRGSAQRGKTSGGVLRPRRQRAGIVITPGDGQGAKGGLAMGKLAEGARARDARPCPARPANVHSDPDARPGTRTARHGRWSSRSGDSEADGVDQAHIRHDS